MNTPLGQNPKRYGIKTNANGEIYWQGHSQWVSEDGTNTWQVRQERLWRLRQLLDGYDHIIWTPKTGQESQPEDPSTPVFHP